MLPSTILSTLLVVGSSLIPTASANWGPLGVRENFGLSLSSNILKGLSIDIRQQCSVSGSFYTKCQASGNILCSSSITWTLPQGDCICPLGSLWAMHKWNKVCIPKRETCPIDCGEGYTYNKQAMKCQPVPGNCGWNSWWHPRSSSCCPNQPKPGKCPGGISCPTDWYWCNDSQRCRPNHPRSPEPDCDDWDSNKHCCGHQNPQPSSGNGGHGGHGGHGWKRSQARIGQSELDARYCPAPLTACSINATTATSPEWSYECLDTQRELESCGGCASEGKGVDCTALPGARFTGCEDGVCQIFACLKGYTLAADNKTCVRDSN